MAPKGSVLPILRTIALTRDSSVCFFITFLSTPCLCTRLFMFKRERKRKREKGREDGNKLGLSELPATIDYRKRHPLLSLTAPFYNHHQPKIRKKELLNCSTFGFTFSFCPAEMLPLILTLVQDVSRSLRWFLTKFSLLKFEVYLGED